MFAIEVDLFSIETIAVPTHTKLVPKPVCILYIGIKELIQKQLVKTVGVLTIKLAIPPNTVNNTYLKKISI
jgi:hypothetical protein